MTHKKWSRIYHADHGKSAWKEMLQNEETCTLWETVIATVKANLVAIASVVESAAASIEAATSATAGDIESSLASLVQQDIDVLTSDIATVEVILQGISVALTVTVTNLLPSKFVLHCNVCRLAVTLNGSLVIDLTVGSEISAVESALESFLTPLGAFIKAVEDASVSATLSITGLQSGAALLETVVVSVLGITGLF